MHIIAIHMGIYYWLFSYLYDILSSQMLFVIQWIISDISYNQHNHIIILYQKINLQCVKKHPSLPLYLVCFPNMVRYLQKVPIGSSCVRPSLSALAGRQGLGANSWVIILSWADWEGRREGWLEVVQVQWWRGRMLFSCWARLGVSVISQLGTVKWRNWNRKIFTILEVHFVFRLIETVIINNIHLI